MSVRSTLTVSVTPELKAFVAGRLATGRYANASEVVRAALRLMERHEPDLKAARRRPAEDGAADR
jgi:antitoxin ParD1/3/4